MMQSKLDTLVLASQNKGKLEEFSKLISNEKVRLLLLNNIGCTEDIPETADTMEGNAKQKAAYVLEKYKYNCISDDSGLEVEALNGAPGVYSARYAGNHKNNEDNVEKLLNELRGNLNRKARFRTVLCLCINGDYTFFEGIINGTIASERRGTKGFGYDPVFIPDGYTCTFAELDLEEKNKISHRAMAVKKLVEYLNNHLK